MFLFKTKYVLHAINLSVESIFIVSKSSEMLCFHIHSILKRFFFLSFLLTHLIQVRFFSFYNYLNSLLFQLFLISLKNSGRYLSVLISLETSLCLIMMTILAEVPWGTEKNYLCKIFCKDLLGQLGSLALEFLFLVIVWMIYLLMKGGIELTLCNCLNTNMWFKT